MPPDQPSVSQTPAVRTRARGHPMPVKPSEVGVYIIHLPRRRDRMGAVNSLKSFFGNRNCDVHVITGLDGLNDPVPTEWAKWKMSHNATKKLHFCDEDTATVHKKVWTEHLTDGEIGCAVSHYRAWTRASEGGHKYVLIFEDDCDLGSFNFGKLWDVLSDLEHVLEKPADMVRLAFSKHDPRGSVSTRDQTTTRRVVPVNAGKSFLVEDSCSWMGAYVLSTAGCKKLASCGLDTEPINVDDFIYALSGAHPRTDLGEAPSVLRMATHSQWTAYRLFMGKHPITWPWGVLETTPASEQSDTRVFPTADELMAVEAAKKSRTIGGINTTPTSPHLPYTSKYIVIYQIFVYPSTTTPHPLNFAIFSSENGCPAWYENVGHRGTACEQCTIKIVSFRATWLYAHTQKTFQ
jgi:GR25 family glycosyltransferase involved in LPS biosynthesis